MSSRRVCLGIDLGNSYICCGVWTGDDRVEILLNEEGRSLTPACVSFSADGKLLIGDAAKSQMSKIPQSTFFDLRRMLGATYADIREEAQLWPFSVSPDAAGRPLVHCAWKGQQRRFRAEQLCALVLANARSQAEQRLGSGNITAAVLTVPARFSDAQRRAARDAAHIAGLDVLRVLNAPTAAAVAFCFDCKGDSSSGRGAAPPADAASSATAATATSSGGEGEQIVLVFSLSGDSCDASLVAAENGVLEVRASAGDRVGGEDFDNRILELVAREFERTTGASLDGDARALSRLRAACERAKCLLSGSASQRIQLERLHGALDLDVTLTRAAFDEACADLFDRCLGPVDKVLSDAGVAPSAVREIIAVGGASRTPAVQRLLSARFGGRRPTTGGTSPDEAAARGAAIQGAILTGQGGAKVHGMLLLDVAPFSLGVECNGGRMAVLVTRNTPIPTRHAHAFQVAPPGAPNTTMHLTLPLSSDARSVALKVCEGESAVAAENSAIGLLHLTVEAPAVAASEGGAEGQTAAPASSVRVVFDLDADCVFTVRAEDAAHPEQADTGRVVIRNESGHLTKEEVERMAADHQVLWADARAAAGAGEEVA